MDFIIIGIKRKGKRNIPEFEFLDIWKIENTNVFLSRVIGIISGLFLGEVYVGGIFSYLMCHMRQQ